MICWGMLPCLIQEAYFLKLYLAGFDSSWSASSVDLLEMTNRTQSKGQAWNLNTREVGVSEA